MMFQWTAPHDTAAITLVTDVTLPSARMKQRRYHLKAVDNC